METGLIMSVVLISGASGFVGRHLAAWLAGQGHQVWALDRLAQPLTAVLTAAYTWDDLSAIEWPAVSAVIHLAGKAHDTRHTTDPQTYFDVNLGLTQRLYESFRASPARIFMQFSSVKAVADRVPVGTELSEEATPQPRTPYGQSKLAAERYLQGEPLAENRRLYILRPCMIHGPGNKGNLNLLYAFARRGLPYPLAAFDNRRSFTGIENLCQAVAGLLRVAPASGIYQLADDEPLATTTLMALMAESLGRRPRSWRLAPGLVRWCARMGDYTHLPLNTERLEKLTESYVVSNYKIKQALGLTHFPVTAADGVRRTLAAFRAGEGK